MTDIWGLLLLGILVPLAVNEFGDLGGWIARHLLCWGARRLGSAEMAERYSEEWLADLERVPGKLTKIGYAFGVVVWGVLRMRLQFAVRRRRSKTSGDDARQVATVRIVPPPDAPVAWDRLHGIERYAICLQETKAGNRRAMAALVSDLTPLVWHVARGNGLTTHASEDVVQDVWLILLDQLGSIDEPRDLAGWLITTTRQQARRALAGPCQPETRDDLPPDLGDRDTALWRAFGRLPVQYQEVLRLTVLAGQTEYDVVAEAMRVSMGEVDRLKAVALESLRESLASEFGSRRAVQEAG